MSQPQQGTKVLVYSPDVNAYIATQRGIIDVSEDIVKGQVKRVENSVSQASLTLNNLNKQYTGVIQRMDRIVIFLTRVQKLQVFAGYVDSAPFLDLYPTTCTVTASCTLKRLLYTYWDPGLYNSIKILDQQTYNGAGAQGSMPGAAGSTPIDSGMGAMLANLLVKVGGWDKATVKIQNFPMEFLTFAIATNVDPNAYYNSIKTMQQMLGMTGSPGQGGGAPAPGGGSKQGPQGGSIPPPAGGALMKGNIPPGGGTYGGQALNADQIGMANWIAGQGRLRNESGQAIAIALMTAMQESTLRNLSYGDRDSVGLFQQRPSQGWGAPANLMDPSYASQQFFDHLDSVPNWQSMTPAQAAQAVQGSAYPDAYAKWANMANALVAAGGVGAGATAHNQAPRTPPPPAPKPGDAAPTQTTQVGAGFTPDYAYGLFNNMFQNNAFFDAISQSLYGEKALINDQQLMSMIQSVCKAGLRSFQSSPDGKFVAYYPDYFGIHSGSATLRLEDIEMKNVSIQISDAALATHVYTAGDSTSTIGDAMQKSPELAWSQTQGFVTIENQDVFKMMLNIDPKTAADYTPDAIYKRYGARPLVMNMPMIKDPLMERFQALHIFMQQWAKQYETKVSTTFLPEVFPGMRVELGGHSLTVYVSAVTHTFDRAKGFSTEMNIMAPSTPSGGLPGLPVSRAAAGAGPPKSK